MQTGGLVSADRSERDSVWIVGMHWVNVCDCDLINMDKPCRMVTPSDFALESVFVFVWDELCWGEGFCCVCDLSRTKCLKIIRLVLLEFWWLQYTVCMEWNPWAVVTMYITTGPFSTIPRTIHIDVSNCILTQWWNIFELSVIGTVKYAVLIALEEPC